MKGILLGVVLVIAGISPCLAWEGYDWERGSYVEVERGNLVRTGRDIEIYDSDAGTYRDVAVEGIRETSTGVELEVYDYEAGEYRTIDMEK